MEQQKKMMDMITEYGKKQGKDIVFKPLSLPDQTENVVKYVEVCETEEGNHFKFAIYVNENGTTKICSFVGFDPLDENIDLTNRFIEELNNRVEAFEYSFDKIIMVSTYVDEETVDELGASFEELVFEVTKEELCKLRIAATLLVEKEVDFDEAVDIALGNDEEADREFDPADFMYWFEHRLLVDNFIEDPKSFIQRCLGTMEASQKSKEDIDDLSDCCHDNYVYGIFCQYAMNENVEHDLSADNFAISVRMIDGKYKVISISLPKPIRERLCYRMDIIYEEGTEEKARLFTIEKSENTKPFLCSWVDRNDKRTHLNYNLAPKNSTKYDATLVEIYKEE